MTRKLLTIAILALCTTACNPQVMHDQSCAVVRNKAVPGHYCLDGKSVPQGIYVLRNNR